MVWLIAVLSLLVHCLFISNYSQSMLNMCVGRTLEMVKKVVLAKRELWAWEKKTGECGKKSYGESHPTHWPAEICHQVPTDRDQIGVEEKEAGLNHFKWRSHSLHHRVSTEASVLEQPMAVYPPPEKKHQKGEEVIGNGLYKMNKRDVRGSKRVTNR